jgi:hypothetical protein
MRSTSVATPMSFAHLRAKAPRCRRGPQGTDYNLNQSFGNRDRNKLSTDGSQFSRLTSALISSNIKSSIFKIASP